MDGSKVLTSFDTQEKLNRRIGEILADSDVVLESVDGIGRAYAFATCSYQSGNSRTVVYASLTG